MHHTITTARAADRDELLALLATAFRAGNPEHPDFDLLYPDLFLATDAAMAPHHIIRHEGRIIACVGAYPFRLRLGPCTVDGYGIGQVSCLPGYRGTGCMTALLNHACRQMETSGAAVSWLSGRRDRYARFGWEIAGCNLRSAIGARSLGPAPAGWRVNTATPATVFALRANAAVRDETSFETWQTRLHRGGKPHRLLVAEHPSLPRACAVFEAGGTGLREWAGPVEGLHALLAHTLQTQPRVAVTYAPRCVDPAAAFFWDASEQSGATLSNLRILNLPALLTAYAPLLRQRLPANAGAILAITGAPPQTAAATLGVAGGAVLPLDRLAMVRLLFGPLPPSMAVDLPPALRWLDQVFPLPFILPEPAHV